MMRILKRFWVLITIGVLSLVYVLGPYPTEPLYTPGLPTVPEDFDGLEAHITAVDSRHTLKPDNEAEIVWFDGAREKTEYAVVYLHGFSASKMEGEPVHRDFARKFGCNLFLTRLSDHGIDTTEMLLNFTVDRVWHSAKEALQIGSRIGKKVILMGTSTGSTLALKLAAEYPDQVYALINLSPNITINNGAAFLLNNPWGLYIARAVFGGIYRDTRASDEHARYWNRRYRLEALTELQELIETSMTPQTFSKITQPSLTLYYYKNEEEQDPEVTVADMLKMHGQLSTPDSLKVAIALPKTGAHVIGSSLTSGDISGVSSEIERFAIEKLRMNLISD